MLHAIALPQRGTRRAWPPEIEPLAFGGMWRGHERLRLQLLGLCAPARSIMIGMR